MMEFVSGSVWSACSIAGSARTHNSDAYSVSECEGRLVVAVADGVGALEGSPLASKAAVRAATQWACGADLSRQDASESLFAAANEAIRQALAEDRVSTGATTLVCAVLEPAGVYLVTVGDSEIIAVDGDAGAVRLNPLDQVEDQPNVLTAWLDGQAVFQPHSRRLERLPDRLLLVTDGVSKGLDYGRIGRVMRDTEAVLSARSLVEAALAAGVTDDITAVVVFGQDAAG